MMINIDEIKNNSSYYLYKKNYGYLVINILVIMVIIFALFIIAFCEFEDTIRVEGIVENTEISPYLARQSGELKTFFVNDGDDIASGQLLFIYDLSQIEKQKKDINESINKIINENKLYNKLVDIINKNSSNSFNINDLEEYHFHKQVFNYQQKIVVVDNQIDELNLRIKNINNYIDYLKGTLKDAKDKTSIEQSINNQILEFQKLNNQLTTLNNERINLGLTIIDEALLTINLNNQKIKVLNKELDKLNEETKNHYIYAHNDGKIKFTHDLRNNKYIGLNQEIFQILTKSENNMKLYVPNSHLDRYEIGDIIRFHSNTSKINKIIVGTIESIDNSVIYRPNSTEGYIEFIISLQNTTNLQNNQYLSGTLILGKKKYYETILEFLQLKKGVVL